MIWRDPAEHFVALRIEADGRTPFLGAAQVRHTGPMTLKMRARSTAGGAGKVQWKTADQENFPEEGQIVEYALPAGADWQDVTIDVPVRGRTAIVRLYLPATESPVEIESIEFYDTNSNKPLRAWGVKECVSTPCQYSAGSSANWSALKTGPSLQTYVLPTLHRPHLPKPHFMRFSSVV